MDKKYSILVGEDDKFYANIYQTKLAKEGYEIRVVGDGNAVLAALKEKKPDLLLLDLIMPDKDGFETLADIKKDPTLKDLKVVVMSNLSQEEDIKKTKELGALDHFVKANISIQELLEKIKKYLA